jgi:predicted phosphodiesterase
MKSRIAVISDIHANADALNIVLKEIKKNNVDITVFLGDILTYGCQPVQVLEILIEYKRKNSLIFIKGNHDQFYFDLQSGLKKTSYKLPRFIDESVSWTLKQIYPLLLEDIFEWHENYRIGDVYFSHANPFSYGDWSYVEQIKDLHMSFEALSKKDVFAGVFGHSHRQLFMGIKKNILNKMDSYSANDADIDQLIINTGTVGQPRGKGIGYTLLNMKDDKLHNASFEKIKMDFDNSIDLIQQTKLSKDSKKKLIDYLEM